MPERPLFGRALGIQMYALGQNAYNDLDATFAALAAIGYAEVEVGQGAKPAADVRAALSRAGLTCPSIHMSVGAGASPDAIARSAEYAHAVGANYACMTIFPFVKPFPSAANPTQMLAALARSYTADDWRRAGDILNITATGLHSAGLAFAYHNHNPEFTPAGDSTGFDAMIARTDPSLVKLEVDVGWLKAAGIDPATFVRQHAARVRLMHLKDLKSSTPTNFALTIDPTEVGSGAQDWPALLQAARDAGVEHFLVEQEPPFERPELDSARLSFQYLQNFR
ncbi:MAG: sugar phosphate isomerase/epimerase [Hyphomonadaceae bacterium]|nr:sugar phosphate isomerase/epimerase [Hyphomonadaceae bacterium]